MIERLSREIVRFFKVLPSIKHILQSSMTAFITVTESQAETLREISKMLEIYYIMRHDVQAHHQRNHNRMNKVVSLNYLANFVEGGMFRSYTLNSLKGKIYAFSGWFSVKLLS